MFSKKHCPNPGMLELSTMATEREKDIVLETPS